MKLCEWWRLNIQKSLHRRLAYNAPHTQSSNIADGFVFSISVWNVSCCCFFVFHDGNWKLLRFGSFIRPNKELEYVHLHFGILGFRDTSPNSSPDWQANALMTCNLWPSNINLSRKRPFASTLPNTIIISSSIPQHCMHTQSDPGQCYIHHCHTWCHSR